MGRIATARLAACLLTALGILGGHVLRAGVPAPTDAVRLERVPYRIGPWEGRELHVSRRVREALGADTFLLREYRDGSGIPVWVFVSYHRVQRLGSYIHSPRVCYTGGGWNLLGTELSALPARNARRPVCWLRVRRGGDDRLALYWFQSRRGRFSRELGLKWEVLRSALVRRPSDAALFRFSTPVEEGDEDGARARILRFLESAEADLQRELPLRAPS